MWIQEFPHEAPAGERRARAWAATLLRGASHALDGLAQRLALEQAPPAAVPVIEFHGDAGAPEGALYVDGQLVGHVLGVNKL